MSGKDAVRVTLRLPKSLHAEMERIAKHEGLSLNAAIVLQMTNCNRCWSIEPGTGRGRVDDPDRQELTRELAALQSGESHEPR